MAEQQKQYITPETKAKLEAELQELIDHRPVVAAEINERREEGDLKENAGYDAAREMQDQEEARIKQISEVLANATTERGAVQEGVAHTGSVVHVYYNGDKDDKETFLIGTRAAASDNKDLETYSEQSPLGAAILGAAVGATGAVGVCLAGVYCPLFCAPARCPSELAGQSQWCLLPGGFKCGHLAAVGSYATLVATLDHGRLTLSPTFTL